MAEAVIIDRVEDDSYDGKAFKKVTDKAGNTFNVKYGRGGSLKAKWGLLVPGNAIEITWGEFNGKPYVQDFVVVAEASEVAKLGPKAAESPPLQEGETPPPPPAPQAVGMLTKEIGDMIRAKMLTTLFGATIKSELVKWYRSQVFGISRITYDGKDLPENK